MTFTLNWPWSNIGNAHRLIILDICAKLFVNPTRGSKDIEQTWNTVIQYLILDCYLDLEPNLVKHRHCTSSHHTWHLCKVICKSHQGFNRYRADTKAWHTDRRPDRQTTELKTIIYVSPFQPLIAKLTCCSQIITIALEPAVKYFKLLSGKDFMLQVTVTLTLDLLTPKSIGIIYGQWPTKTPIMVPLSLLDKDFMLQVTVTFTFDLLTLKSIRIIYRSWPTKTPIMVSLSLIKFQVIERTRILLVKT